MGGGSAVSRVHFVKSRSLKCSLDEAKHRVFRATNAVFGKIGRVASEEVVLELVKVYLFANLVTWCRVLSVK